MAGIGNPVFKTVGGDVSSATVLDPNSGKPLPVSDWFGSFATAEKLVEVTTSGATALPQVAGYVTYVVTPSAASTLSFPSFPTNAVTQVTLVVAGSNYSVALPTNGVLYKSGDVPVVDTTPGHVTVVRYLSVPGIANIVGGI